MNFRNAVVIGGLVAFASGCAYLPEGAPSRTNRVSSPADLFISDDAPSRALSGPEKPGLKIRKSTRGNMESYVVRGERYHTLDSAEGYSARGVASWYGPNFHGRTASNGEVYDMYRLTAAHKTLPLPTYARVTHVENGRSVIVKINDRGPFSGDRIIDLSFAAALRLGMVNDGTGTVDIQALSPDEMMALSGPENKLDIDFYYTNEDGTESEVAATEPVARPVVTEPVVTEPDDAISVAAVDIDTNPITALPTTAPVTTPKAAPVINDAVASADRVLPSVTKAAETPAEGILLPLDELIPQSESLEPNRSQELAGSEKIDLDQASLLDKEIQDDLLPSVAGASAQGLTVVPAAVQTVPSPAAKDGSGYYVQAGVYADVADAERIAVDVVLAAPGEEVHVKPLKNSLMYRITVGPIVSQQHASDVSGKLSAAGLENFTVNVE